MKMIVWFALKGDELPYYDEASLSHYEDFNLSHEENIGKKSRQSLVLVSQRVKQLFDTLKIKPVYKPVVIVKEE